MPLYASNPKDQKNSMEYLQTNEQLSELDKYYIGLLEGNKNPEKSAEQPNSMELEIQNYDALVAQKMNRLQEVATNGDEAEKAYQQIEQAVENFKLMADEEIINGGDVENLYSITENTETDADELTTNIIKLQKAILYRQAQLRQSVSESYDVTSVDEAKYNNISANIAEEEVDYTERDSSDDRIKIINEVLIVSEYLLNSSDVIDQQTVDQLDKKIENTINEFDNFDREDINYINYLKSRQEAIFKYNKFEEHQRELENRGSGQIWADLAEFSSVDYDSQEVSLDELKANKQMLIDRINEDYQNDKINTENYMKYIASANSLYDRWISMAEKQLEKNESDGNQQIEELLSDSIAEADENNNRQSTEEAVQVADYNKIKIDTDVDITEMDLK